MKKWLILICSLAFFVFGVTTAQAATKINSDGFYRGIKLAGRVKVVDHFPDIKVKVVSHFPDIRVKRVKYASRKVGEWQFVDYGEDFKIQFVDHFEDIKVQFVDSFPGVQ